MSTKEQSATLLRLNKQEQVKALQAVGFADITENSRASEFPNRIKWATGSWFVYPGTFAVFCHCGTRVLCS